MSATTGYPSRFASQWSSPYNSEASSPLAMVSTTPKFNVRTNRQQDPYDVTGNRAVQGEVTANLLVNPDLHRARQETGKMARSKGVNVMGVLTNVENVNIGEGDLVFIPRMQRTLGGSMFGSVKDPYAFSSFTGANASVEVFGNQHGFEASFMLVGKSKIPYRFGSIEQSKSGISVMVSGATTIANDGVETFAFGDTVAWYIYDAFDEQKREQQIMSVRKVKRHGPEHFGALLKRATYRDIFKLTQNALERFAMAVTRGETKQFLLASYQERLPNKGEFDALRRHFRAECMQRTATDAWIVLVTAQQLGVVDLKIPKSSDKVKLSALVDKLNEISINDLRDARFNVEANYDVKKVISPETTKQEDWERAISLGQMLGIVSDPSGSVQPAHELLATLIMREYRGLLESQHSYGYRDQASILLAGPSALLVNGLPANGSLEQRIDRMQLNNVREANKEYYAAYRQATAQNFATCISSTAQPGQEMDVSFS